MYDSNFNLDYYYSNFKNNKSLTKSKKKSKSPNEKLFHHNEFYDNFLINLEKDKNKNKYEFDIKKSKTKTSNTKFHKVKFNPTLFNNKRKKSNSNKKKKNSSSTSKKIIISNILNNNNIKKNTNNNNNNNSNIKCSINNSNINSTNLVSTNMLSTNLGTINIYSSNNNFNNYHNNNTIIPNLNSQHKKMKSFCQKKLILDFESEKLNTSKDSINKNCNKNYNFNNNKNKKIITIDKFISINTISDNKKKKNGLFNFLCCCTPIENK
jgi:hypothetical protein